MKSFKTPKGGGNCVQEQGGPGYYVRVAQPPGRWRIFLEVQRKSIEIQLHFKILLKKN